MQTLIYTLRFALLGIVVLDTTDLFAQANVEPTSNDQPVRPNILWIIVDDMSAEFSCYGEKLIQTPNVDALAGRGIQFNHAYVTAPVCSTCRSAFITGMYQTSIGAHHHRSGRGELKIELPADVQLVPKLFQDAGYYTSISGWPNKKGRLGKTDYNFEWDPSIYNSSDWTQRAPGQPFFAQIQTPGGKLRGASPEAAEKLAAQAKQVLGSATDPADVTLPPYYPNDPVLLQDWAAYLDSIRLTDHMVGEVIEKLRQDGDLENTVVLFMTDHGISHARGKQFLYDEGIHVPLVIAGPGIEHATRNDLVEHIDIAALSLGLAGIEIPKSMQAQDILSPEYVARDAVFSARDRCDETVEHLRSVRTANLKYIRNYLNQRPHMQPCAYKDGKAIVQAMRRLHDEGKLTELQDRIFQPTRPTEELYDLANDPFETRNLAGNPEWARQLEQMRQRLAQWEETTGDMGRQPESPEMYDSDMQVYVDGIAKRNKSPEHAQRIQDNIAQMKLWAKEGK
ncbi:sulfatase family protein [Stieleria varia]|uniref:Choline-sulfatase n=1 Tax=Stieleria varia TaxID=2528005 RepID=A0A5C6B1K3_9BACT|nr:sulfatase [Stieleria varia]TWU05768.1 Choline-sulfatase [Stieleria varia]